MDLLPVFSEVFGFTPAQYRELTQADRKRYIRYLQDRADRIEQARKDRGR